MTSIGNHNHSPVLASGYSVDVQAESTAVSRPESIDVYEGLKRRSPVDSAKRRRAHQAKKQTSARETIENVRDTLNGLPELVRHQARIILDNNGLMTAMVENPSVMRGLGKGEAESMTIVREQMDNFVNRAALEGAYWTGLLSQAEKPLDELATTLETNDQLRNGLLLAVELDLPLGEVLTDVRTGALNADMLVRFMDGSPKPCDLASIFLYVREKAGGLLVLDGSSPVFRSLLDTLPIDERINTDAIESIRIASDDTIRVKFSETDPLVASSVYDLGLGSQLIIDVNANPVEGEGAFILSPRLPQGIGLKAVFFDLHLHLSGNGRVDQFIEILLKIIFSPVLLIAGLVVDSTDKRYVAPDAVAASSA